MTTNVTMSGSAFAPVHQDYLFQARQFKALSFAVHIPGSRNCVGEGEIT